MAITEAFANTQVVTTSTQWSCPRDAAYDVAQPQTGDGVYQVFLDISDMVSADELEIRVYEKVQAGDTSSIVYQCNLVGPQSPPIWVSPSLVLINGWDVTLNQMAGTANITITWSIRRIA